VRRTTLFLTARVLVLLAAAGPAAAQTFSLDFGDDSSTTGRIVQLLAPLTVLSLAPPIFVMAPVLEESYARASHP
jgi:flagellar biosynthetic protein FliP